MDGYLSKPFKTEEIEQILRQWLGELCQHNNPPFSSPPENSAQGALEETTVHAPSTPLSLDLNSIARLKEFQTADKPNIARDIISTYIKDIYGPYRPIIPGAA